MACYKSVSTAAIMVALSAPASFADITGAQVWSDWKDYMQSFGYETTGAETQSGGTLTIRDITMSAVLPEDEGSVALTMGTLSFVDNADGTVSVELPTQMPVSFDMAPSTGDAAQGTLLVTQSAPVMIVSGDPGDFTYTYTANSMTMTVQDVVADGADITSEMFNMTFEMNDISSTTRTTIGALRGYEGRFSAAGLTYDIGYDVEDGPEAGKGRFTGGMTDVSVSATGAFPEGIDSAEVGEMISAGMDVTSTLRYESGSSDVQIDAPDGSIAATTQSGGGMFAVAMGADGLRYDLTQNDVEMTAQVPDFPFPVSLSIAENAFSFGMPVMMSSDPQDFAFGFKLGDFTISDVIWNLFDPAVQLPRDPATLELDLTGTARILSDIFDPVAMASTATPGEINTLDIRALVIDMIGARLSGSGAFAFDNSDLVTFDGVPRPEGALDLRLEGANALIERLVGMGLLPQEQAMGARMMMGLFGVPQGDDTLTSKIEVNAEGHVLANGQRLQ